MIKRPKPVEKLAPEERAALDAGLCACLCGEVLPKTRRDWRGQLERDPRTIYVDGAHKQRAYRNRARTGRVQTPEQRRAELLNLEAADLERRALDAEQTARSYAAEAARCRRIAAEKRLEASGQLKIPCVTERAAAARRNGLATVPPELGRNGAAHADGAAETPDAVNHGLGCVICKGKSTNAIMARESIHGSSVKLWYPACQEHGAWLYSEGLTLVSARERYARDQQRTTEIPADVAEYYTPEILAQPCQLCNAAPGGVCVTLGKRSPSSPHGIRKNHAERAAKRAAKLGAAEARA